MDLEPYLGRLAHELTTSRTYHFFLNRLRWLALSQHQSLRQAMGAETWIAHQHVNGGLGDAFASQTASASTQGRSARGLVLSGHDGDAAALVRATLPLNNADFAVHRPWCMLLALHYQLEYAGGETAAEQLEVFYQAQRCFESRFRAQLQARPMLILEADLDDENQAAATFIILRPSDWVRGNAILPQQDARQEQRTAHLQALRTSLDELLSTEVAFAARDDMDYATLRLRQRAGTTAKPARVKTLQVTAYQRGEAFAGGMWTDMYHRQPDSEKGMLPALDELEQEEEDAAPSSINDRAVQKDGFLAALYLRHVHVRDLQAQARAWLNYFRSIERQVHHDLRMLRAAEHLRHDRDALSACLQGHEEDFHHDHYALVDTVVRVHDADNRPVCYDCVDDDFRALEQELLALGTHHLQRSAKTEFQDQTQEQTMQQTRSRTPRGRPTSSRHSSRAAKDGHVKENAAIDVALFAQGTVDRGAVLLDLWLWEVGFLREKQRLLACLLTAYELTVDALQRQQLLQSMVDLLYRRPLYDLEAEYFASSYHVDTQSLRLQRQLYLNVIDHLMQQHQQTSPPNTPASQVSNSDPDTTRPPGRYPAASTSTITIALHDLEPAQAFGHVRIQPLEFVDTIGVIATLDQALTFALNEAKRVHQPSSLLEYNRLRAAVMDHALEAWSAEVGLGGLTKELDEDLRHLLEDSALDQTAQLVNISRAAAVQACQGAAERGGNEQAVQGAGACVIGTALELVTLRHRLLLLSHEGIILTKVYQACCARLGVGEHHACLRPMTFATAGSSKIEVSACLSQTQDMFAVPHGHALAFS